MKYETPEMTVLTPAINAIQAGDPQSKPNGNQGDGTVFDEVIAGYADWE